ncbi:MAG: tetratricopeptide repeat protein [Candidatus Lindowbacteria bacterium]|nr:tetratricopeptide repeat protein [Candidatus Lindowbacteria bacterium]
MRLNFPKNNQNNVVSLERFATGQRPHKIAKLLSKAEETPEDTETWVELFHAALSEGRYPLARKIANRCGDGKELLLAQVSIVSGEPARAVLLLKDSESTRAKSILAWAYFSMSDRHSAAALWKNSDQEDERKLSEVLLGGDSDHDENGAVLLRSLINSHSFVVSSAAHRLLAEFHFQNDNYKTAIRWFRQAEWMMPRDLSLKRMIARSAEKTGNVKMAKSRWESITLLSPEDAEGFEKLGHASLEEGNIDEAKSSFKRALTIDPFRIRIRILLGDMAHESGEEDEALEHFETAFRIDPQDRTILTRLTDLYWQQGRIKDASDYCIKLYTAGFPPGEDEDRSEIFGYLLAEMLLSGEMKYREVAEQFFAECKIKHAQNLLLRLYHARCLLALEQKEEARQTVLNVLKLDPGLPEALYELGNMFLLEGDLTSAMPLMERAAQRDPDLFYRKELGKCCLDSGDWKGAERHFKKVLANASDDEEILFGLYAALFYQGKYRRSENLLRRILRTDPSNLQAKTYLAEVLLALQHYDEAFETIKPLSSRAISLDRFIGGKGEEVNVVEPVGVIEWLSGFASMFVGRYRRAGSELKRAMKIAPDLTDWCPELKAAVIEKLKEGNLPEKTTKDVLDKLTFIDPSNESVEPESV